MANLNKHVKFVKHEPTKCTVCRCTDVTMFVSFWDMNNPGPNLYNGKSGPRQSLPSCDKCVYAVTAIVLQSEGYKLEEVTNG